MTVTLGFTGSAANNVDYSASGTSITIPAGQTSGTITLTGVNDFAFEGNESIVVDVTSVTNGTENGTQSVTAMITDDDPQFIAPTLDLNGAIIGTSYQATVTQAGATIAIVNNTSLMVVDPDSATLTSAALVLNQAPNGTNESLAVDVTGTPIIANYNSANRTLSLAGIATVQQYQQVLRTATYRNLALSPNTTTVPFRSWSTTVRLIATSR